MCNMKALSLVITKVKFTLDRRTDRRGDSYIPPQTSFAGGIIN